ncbi:hypothetical protein [Bacillus solitudinis]|uniref:hypothetical protein n=1 Tax=Bacillus solitudinis TaxID=2014074 RepID=UPI000C230CBE|nr:hypothetical protein [Bacillus solitudinis]
MIKLNNLFRTFIKGMFEYLLFFPVVLLSGVFLIDPTLLYFWLVCLSGLFALGLLLKTLLSTKAIWLFMMIVLLVSVATSFAFTDSLWMVFILIPIHFTFMYRGMMYAERDWIILLPTSFLWGGGLTIYFFGYIVYKYVEALQFYLPLITSLAFILISFTLFRTNNQHLRTATLSKKKDPYLGKSIKNQNRFFLMITLIFVTLLTNGQVIQQAVLNMLRALIQAMVSLFSEDGVTQVEQGPPSARMESILPTDEYKPSAFAIFIDRLMTYLIFGICVIVIILCLLFLVKKTRDWLKTGIRRLIDYLKKTINAKVEQHDNYGYVDEKETIFNWNLWKHEQKKKLKSFTSTLFKREPKWDSLSNQEKIRYLYRQILSEHLTKGGQIHHIDTPFEAFEKLYTSGDYDKNKLNQLLKAYEATRYGDLDVGEKKIKHLSKIFTSRIKNK